MPIPVDSVSHVTDGHLDDRTRRQIAAALRAWDGLDVRVRLSAPVRSGRAHRFYFAARVQPVVHALALAGQATPVWRVHDHFKEYCLPVAAEELLHDTGEVVDYIEAGTLLGKTQSRLTTTRLSVPAFTRFIECLEADDLVLQLGVEFAEAIPTGLRSGRIAELSDA